MASEGMDAPTVMGDLPADFVR